MSDADDILAEREETHGDYENTARIIQRFKRVLYSELMERELRGQDDLSDVALETLHMVLHKMGRIVSGKWDHPDHWKDMSCYPALVVRSIEDAAEWVEYKTTPADDAYDEDTDALGSYNVAIKTIGDDVKAGRRELPDMFKPSGLRFYGGHDPGDETKF